MTGIDIPLGGDIAPFHAAIAELRGTVAKLGQSMRGSLAPAQRNTTALGTAFRRVGAVGRAAFTGLRSVIRGVYNAVAGLGRRLRNLIPGGGFLGPIAGITAAVGGVALLTSQLRKAFSSAAGFEDLEVRVSAFLGSAEKAKTLLSELQTFADKTPFATIDIQESAGSLLAAGIRENISRITQDIAAVSRDGQQLRELSEAVGKGFARGRFQTRELNTFLQRGINLMPALEKVTGKTGDALQDAIKKGLSFEQVTAAIQSLSQEGGQFYGLLDRRSRTAAGLISTLGSVWDTVRREFAQPVLDALKPALMAAIKFTEGLKERAAALGKQIGQIVLQLQALIQSGKTGELLSKGLKLGVASAIDILMRGMRSAVAFLGTALPPIFEAALATLRDPKFWQGIGQLLTAAAASFEAALARALGKDAFASALEGQAQVNRTLGIKNIQRSGDGTDIADVLTQALLEGGLAAKDAFSEVGPKALAARKAMADLLDTVREQTAALAASAAVPGPAEGATGAGVEGEIQSSLAATGARLAQLATLTTSLGRVGGGGFGMTFQPVVTEQQRTNGLLADIKNKLPTGGTPAPAF